MLTALNQIRVVEQGTFITGPCTGMMLADLGADVIKIESAGNGDPYRSFKTGFYSAHFQAYNRNKRAIGLDLKSESDREVFYQARRASGCLYPELPSRCCSPHRRRLRDPFEAQPQAHLLLDQRVRSGRSLCPAAGL